MATAFFKFLLPPPLRRPLKNLNILPYQVPAFHPPPIQVPNQQLFLRSISYLRPYLPRPRLRRMPGLKSVISRRQRGAKYCTCPDCQSKRFVNRVWPTSYFRRNTRLAYQKVGPQQVCKRKFSTDTRPDDVDPGGYWTRMRRALKSTKVQWYPIPISLGIAYVAFAHLRKMRERSGWQTEPGGEGKPPIVRKDVKVHGPWQLYVLSTLPLRSISRLWGRFNAIELPLFMRVPGYKLYSWIFGCRLDELKEPDLTKYRNLAEFFSRELRDGVRPIDPFSDLVSPLLFYLELIQGLSRGRNGLAFWGNRG
jgi:hypothetical protein